MNMNESEAGEYLGGLRDYRKEVGEPLRNPETTPEERTKTIQDLGALRELYHEDPDYRQALRIIAELRSQREINHTKIEKRAEFPTDPEKRFEAIISSIGNHAGKQITFLSIPSTPGVIVTPWELHTAFVENSGGVWRTSKSVQKAHAQHSLIPIGMVAEESVIRDGSNTELVGFTKTEAGREYGDPIAKFLLKYASEHNISLERIFGNTLSPVNSRAPYNRARILEYLSERKDDPHIRMTDLSELLGIKGTNLIARSLKALQEEGLVIFDSVDFEKLKGKFVYKLNPDFEGDTTSPYESVLASTLNAIKVLQESGTTGFEIDNVFKEIQKDHADSKRNSVRKVFYDLAKNGYFKRGEFEGSKLQSVVSILQEGTEFVNDVVIPLRTSLTDTPEGKALRDEWRNIDWQKYAPNVLKIHKENSWLANMTDPTVFQNAIREIISQNLGIRSSEVENKIKELGLPYKSAKNQLITLFKKGEIRKEIQGKASRWYLVEKGHESEESDEEIPTQPENTP